jgi:alpha-maltose-1-phosphate synthase
VYQGDMALERGLEVFVRAVETVGDRCQLLLVGGGPDLEALQALAQSSARPDTVIVLGRVLRQDLHAIIATGDIGIVTYPDEGLNNHYCASNKVIEYAQAGLPMLTTDQPPLLSAIAEYGIGVACPRDGRTAQGVAEKMLLLGENLEAYRRRLPHFCRSHRWTDEAERLLGAIARLVPPAVPLDEAPPAELRKAA